jgi:putative ABC transport system permease protein
VTRERTLWVTFKNTGDVTLTDITFDAVKDGERLVVEDKGTFRRGAVIIQPMSLIALIVVLLGIGDALLAAVFERSRELGTMRALGATPRSVAGFVVAQAVAICLLGAVLAPALALALSFALLEVTSISVLGWRSEVVLARTTTAVVLASGIVAALASAALPAWRATRVAPADALRAE